MRPNRMGLIGLAAVALLMTLLWSPLQWTWMSWNSAMDLPSAQVAYAQAPAEEPTSPADPAEVPAEPDAASPEAPAPAVPTPLPAPPQAAQEPPILLSAEPLPLAGSYEDPQQRFQVGILEGYDVSSIAGAPLFEAQDGRLAYTVVLVPPIFEATAAPLSSSALVQVAQDVFERGEGFQVTEVQPIPQAGVLISWLGSLTIGGMPQPMQGTIVARDQGGTVYLMLIAATETGVDVLPAATATLYNSLQVL